MVGELITLPLRATGLVARLSWRAAERTANLSWEVAGFVAGRVKPDQSPDLRQPRTAPTNGDAPQSDRWQSERTFSATPPVAPWEPSPPAAPTELPSTEPSDASLADEPAPTLEEPAHTPIAEPTHVSEEPELVEEFAEPGAEDGAGAEIHIREPWEGYRHMNARQVTARLSNASPSELAAVQLYESSTRGRQTILSAVTRQLRSATGNGSRA